MYKRLTTNQISEIKKLRRMGFSLPEISSKLGIGRGTAFRHIKGVDILRKYKPIWLAKRKGSIKRKIEADRIATFKAKKEISTLNNKEKLILLSSLYWAEGAKKDFNLTNSDPLMIRVFVDGMRQIFNVDESRFKLNIRIYEDMDVKLCVRYWLKITNLSSDNISSVNILKGKKVGKLQYGLCRVRITKAGDMLKYMVAVRNRVSEIMSL